MSLPFIFCGSSVEESLGFSVASLLLIKQLSSLKEEKIQGRAIRSCNIDLTCRRKRVTILNGDFQNRKIQELKV